MNSDTTSTKLALAKKPQFVEFVVSAYEMPPMFRMAMLEMFDDVEMRSTAMITACYLIYRHEAFGEELKQTFETMLNLAEQQSAIGSHAPIADLDGFLAHTVKRKFKDRCTIK